MYSPARPSEGCARRLALGPANAHDSRGARAPNAQTRRQYGTPQALAHHLDALTAPGGVVRARDRRSWRVSDDGLVSAFSRSKNAQGYGQSPSAPLIVPRSNAPAAPAAANE